MSVKYRFDVDATENAALFTDANLAKYDVVIFLCTTGDVLNAAQQAAFERYIQAGGGYAGIHSASDTEYEWPWYGGLVGAYLRDHPGVDGVNAQFQVATMNVEDRRTACRAARPDGRPPDLRGASPTTEAAPSTPRWGPQGGLLGRAAAPPARARRHPHGASRAGR